MVYRLPKESYGIPYKVKKYFLEREKNTHNREIT